jgi:hypothetical protein
LILRHNDEATQSTRDMAAYFKAYQDRENVSPERSEGQIRRREQGVPPPHELTSKTRPQRRRTTDGLHRTKSSKLPLERVPRGHHVQNIVLPLALSIAGIMQSSHKLDMRVNSPDWPYLAEEAYDAFSEPVSERRVMDWVIKLDASMGDHFERLRDADVRSLMHEAIQCGLDGRKNDQTMGTADIIDLPTTATGVNLVPTSELLSVQPPVEHSGAEMEDTIPDFDMSPFVDFDGGDDVDAKLPIHDNISQSSDDFGIDIDDDMLLDM